MVEGEVDVELEMKFEQDQEKIPWEEIVKRQNSS